MPFNISQFKTQLERYGGPARTNLFDVQLLRLPTGIPVNENYDALRGINLFCTKMSMPGIAFNTADANYVGQMGKKFPTVMQNPGPITATFLVDSDHNLLSFFHLWARQIVNYTKGDRPFAELGGKLPHEVGFKKDYACDMIVKHYTTDSFPDSYYEAKLIKTYPTSISSLDFSWDGSTTFLTLDVQFQLEDIVFSSDNTLKTNNRSSRGGGLLDILGDIAGFADTVRGTIKAGKPTSIQDAINRLDRLGNAIDNLGDNI